MLNDVVLLIKRIEEASTCQSVVPVGAPVLLFPQLAAQNEHRAAIRFHRLERLEGDRLINLCRASSIAG